MHDDTREICNCYRTELPLHYATFFGLEDVIQKLTTHHQDLVDYSKCIHIAAVKGYTDIVKLLIDKAVLACVQRYDESDDAMQAESVKDLMKHLFKWEPILVYLDKYGTVFQAASNYGHIKIVRLVLDKGSDTKFHGGAGNALTIASKNGYVCHNCKTSVG